MEASWLAAVLLVPLFFQTSTARIFEPDKMILVRLLAVVMAVAWLVRMIDTRLARPVDNFPDAADDGPDDEAGFWQRVMPLLWPVLLLSVATVVAAGASIAVWASVFGAYQRGQGLLSFAAFLVIFLVTLAGLRRADQLDRLVTAVILGGGIVSLFAVLQGVGLAPGVFSGLYSGRVFSSLGNPIFVGGYLLVILPLTWMRLAQPGPAPLRGLYGLLLALEGLALFLTLSLGAWIGLVVMAGVLTLAVVTQRAGRRAVLAVAIVAPLLVGALLFALNTPAARSAVAEGPPALRRLTHLFDAGDRSTLRVRLLLWEAAARTMAIDPIRLPFGYGPETNIISLSTNVSPALRYLEDASRNPDRAHNEVWDRLIETGVPGLIGYTWLIIAAFYLIARRLGWVATRDRFWTFVGLTAGGATAGALLPVLVGLPLYLGPGLTAGLIVGLWVFLATVALGTRVATDLSVEGRWLLIALLAALAGHFVEVNIGPIDPTRRLMFWMIAAVIGAVAARPSLLSDNLVSIYEPTPALAYGGLAALAMVTLGYTFVPLDDFNLAANNYGVVWLLSLSLLLAGALLWFEARREAGEVEMEPPSLAPVVGLALAGLAVMLGLRAVVLLAGGDALSLLWVYLLALLAGLALLAWWLPSATEAWARATPLALVLYASLTLGAAALALYVIVLPIQADMMVRTAEAYLAAGDPTTALRLAGRAVATQPREPVYAIKLGEWLATAAPLAKSPQDQDQLYQQAVEAFSLAADEWPVYGDYRYNVGHTYLLWAQTAQDATKRTPLLATAFQNLQQAGLLDPTEPDNFVEAAQAAILADQSPQNIQALLLQALTVDPRNVQAYVLLGRLYLAAGQTEGAERALQNAAQLGAKGTQAAAVYTALGDLYQRQNRLPEAIQAVQKVVELAPDNYAGWQNLAALQQRAGRFPEALAAAQRAHSLAPAEARPRLVELISQIQQGTRPTP